MPYHCTEERWGEHPPHNKCQSRLHADIIVVRRCTRVAGGNWLENSGNIEETSSLKKANVQSKTTGKLTGWRTETSIAIPVQLLLFPSADWKNHRKR